MSGIDIENIREWANSGDVTEPPTTLQDDGYQGGEQPFNEHHNWIWNARDKINNNLVNRANRTHNSVPGLSVADFCSGLNNLLNNDWIHSYAGFNSISFGSNPVVNMCRGWNYTLKRQVIYAVLKDEPTKIVEIRNADDFSIETENHSITIDNTSTETIEAICCDGPYLYVMVEILGSAKFYKFSTNPWSSTKVASAGTPIDIDTGGVGRNTIIVADANTLGFIGKNESTDSDRVINTINKTLTVQNSGRGNAPSSASLYPGTGLASDGFTLFFTVFSVSTENTQLCGANIANLAQATGIGGSFGAKIIGDNTKTPGGVIYDGRHISVIRNDGYLASFNKDVDRYRGLDFLFENAKSPDEQFPKFVFDGFTAWAMFQHAGDDDANNGFIAPFKPQEICLDHPTSRTIQKKEFVSSYTDGVATMDETRMEYSDGCLWFNPKVPGGANLYRLPNILNRR